MPSTKNFVWNEKDLLGRGAYGSVYKVSEILFTVVVLKIDIQKKITQMKKKNCNVSGKVKKSKIYRHN